MATSYQISYTCEKCGEISRSTHTNYTDASNEFLSQGWIFLRLSSGWRHFCRSCGEDIMMFIRGSSGASVKDRKVEPVRAPLTASPRTPSKPKKSKGSAKTTSFQTSFFRVPDTTPVVSPENIAKTKRVVVCYPEDVRRKTRTLPAASSRTSSMTPSKKYKTEGATWLGYSLVGFNGTKYADKSSPENFVQSYFDRKTKKNDTKALVLLDRHWELAVETAKDFCGLI